MGSVKAQSFQHALTLCQFFHSLLSLMWSQWKCSNFVLPSYNTKPKVLFISSCTFRVSSKNVLAHVQSFSAYIGHWTLQVTLSLSCIYVLVHWCWYFKYHHKERSCKVMLREEGCTNHDLEYKNTSCRVSIERTGICKVAHSCWKMHFFFPFRSNGWKIPAVCA